MESPCVKPILNPPWVTTFDRAVGIGKPEAAEVSEAAMPAPAGCGGCGLESGMSKSPFTSWRSGARERRKA